MGGMLFLLRCGLFVARNIPGTVDANASGRDKREAFGLSSKVRCQQHAVHRRGQQCRPPRRHEPFRRGSSTRWRGVGWREVPRLPTHRGGESHHGGGLVVGVRNHFRNRGTKGRAVGIADTRKLRRTSRDGVGERTGGPSDPSEFHRWRSRGPGTARHENRRAADRRGFSLGRDASTIWLQLWRDQGRRNEFVASGDDDRGRHDPPRRDILELQRVLARVPEH